ncbi:DUF6090 family protein [Aureibaculum conchae]|uniref:DUF6090 family protein n=1 Tax=Aureibaculum sp. 2308TA14-22 TaxID=3108392 RepID=UPI003390FA96
MIKFFRKIRQNLLSENKFSKYLIYAIGEIVLVVIGILIALSINNWNERQKDSVIELQLLKSLEKDLETNISRIKSAIYTDSVVLSQNRVLLSLLEDEKSILTDSIQKYFGRINRYGAFFPQKMTYETLKSKGLEIIKNDSIRNKIALLFDDTYSANDYKNELNKEIYVNTNTLLNKRLKTTNIESFSSKVPNNFESLKSDKEFINNLSHISAEKYNFLGMSKYHLQQTEMVRSNIIDEIKKLEE